MENGRSRLGREKKNSLEKGTKKMSNGAVDTSFAEDDNLRQVASTERFLTAVCLSVVHSVSATVHLRFVCLHTASGAAAFLTALFPIQHSSAELQRQTYSVPLLLTNFQFTSSSSSSSACCLCDAVRREAERVQCRAPNGSEEYRISIIAIGNRQSTSSPEGRITRLSASAGAVVADSSNSSRSSRCRRHCRCASQLAIIKSENIR